MRIALVGIYGGNARDFNPGSFMLAYITVLALKKRIPNAEFEVFTFDDYWKDSAPKKEIIDGVTVTFVERDNPESLSSIIEGFNGLVVGGDNLWTFQDLSHFRQIVRDIKTFIGTNYKDVWLLEVGDLFKKATPRVVFNCVSSRSSIDVINKWRKSLTRACERASYIGVRDYNVEKILSNDWELKNIRMVPDPVLGLMPESLYGSPTELDFIKSEKPVLGVAIRPAFAGAFAEVFNNLKEEFDKYHICFYSYSTMHKHWEANGMFRRWIDRGDVSYIDRPLSPSMAFHLTGRFDVVLNDCYHGTIAAIIQGKPVIPIRFREQEVSRRAQLFKMLDLPDRSIRITAAHTPEGHLKNVANLMEQLPMLLSSPVSVPENSLNHVRSLVEKHFDEMANALMK